MSCAARLLGLFSTHYINIYYYIDGNRKSKSFPTGIAIEAQNNRLFKKNERAARRKMDELLQTFVPPVPVEDVPQTHLFTEDIQQWLNRQSQSVAPATFSSYTYAANDIISYFKQHPILTVNITETIIEDYIVWERRRRQPDYIPSPGESKKTLKHPDGSGIENTIMKRIAVIRMVLQNAKRDGLINRNPSAKRDSWIRLPKPQKHSFQCLNIDEAKLLLSCLKAEPLWFVVAVYLGLLYGLRRSEVFGLRLNDIDFVQNRMTIRNSITQQTINGKNVIILDSV